MHRVLVIDDDDGMRRLVKERLKDDYEVIEAPNPVDALALSLEHRPSCVLLDLLMPGLTGFEICRTLTSLSLTQKLPVIVVSGNPAEEYRDYCLRLGAQDYFQKPIDFERLHNRIWELIAQNLPPRSPELRVPLQVMIELRGLDRNGIAFHEVSFTENVSVTGFRCSCAALLDGKAIVEVYLRAGAAKRRVGRAQVVHAQKRGAEAVPEYGFHFVHKPSEWLL